MKAFAIQKMPEFFIEILPSIGVTLEYVVLAFVIGLFVGILLAGDGSAFVDRQSHTNEVDCFYNL